MFLAMGFAPDELGAFLDLPAVRPEDDISYAYVSTGTTRAIKISGMIFACLLFCHCHTPMD